MNMRPISVIFIEVILASVFFYFQEVYGTLQHKGADLCRTDEDILMNLHRQQTCETSLPSLH